jgi:hypothetical protein
MGIFHSRDTKAEWGIPCNQNTAAELWVGKGYKKTYASQFSMSEALAVAKAIEKVRGNRYGRFWVDREKKLITMMVGSSDANTYDKATY